MYLLSGASSGRSNDKCGQLLSGTIANISSLFNACYKTELNDSQLG